MWAKAHRLRHSATQQMQSTTVAEAKSSQMKWLDCTKDVVIHAASTAAPAVGVAPAVRADPAEGPAAPEAVDQPAEHLHHQHQGVIKILCAT